MFKVGAIYNRRQDIHAEFGGNQQSGIVPSPSHPYIFLFSAERGEEFGYKDGWDKDENFIYSGEGQFGNQQFVRGNRAIRDHAANGKELHLFERHGSGTYKYLGQFAVKSHKFVTGKDAQGNDRQLIKFFLRKV
jgi:5-methylcytosine-specific restriction enzyme A